MPRLKAGNYFRDLPGIIPVFSFGEHISILFQTAHSALLALYGTIEAVLLQIYSDATELLAVFPQGKPHPSELESEP
jgi:hypothetical protein